MIFMNSRRLFIYKYSYVWESFRTGREGSPESYRIR